MRKGSINLSYVHENIVEAFRKREKNKMLELLKEYPQVANYPSGLVRSQQRFGWKYERLRLIVIRPDVGVEDARKGDSSG